MRRMVSVQRLALSKSAAAWSLVFSEGGAWGDSRSEAMTVAQSQA
jgi:hypothetical protein